MLPEELLKKVRFIELHTRRLVDEAFSGQYKSQFKGQGMTFSEHRQYVAGDDVRHIDWKVSARTRDPMIKKFEEERELAVLLIVDVSGSEQFGSLDRFKSEVSAEIAGMLAYAAIHSGDRVGLILFASEVEKMVPLKKGKTHLRRLIRDVLSTEPKTRGTALKHTLDNAFRLLKHKSVVFLVSDFLTPTADYAQSLKRLSKKHDVVAIRVEDPRETTLPAVSGSVWVVDPETGAEGVISIGSQKFKTWFKDHHQKVRQRMDQSFKEAQVDVLRVSTQEDYGDAVARFFQLRARRLGSR